MGSTVIRFQAIEEAAARAPKGATIRPIDMAELSEEALARAIEALKDVSARLNESFVDGNGPSSMSVSMGLTVTAEGSVYVATLTGECTLGVTLEWTS